MDKQKDGAHAAPAFRADTRPLTGADCVYCGSDMDRTPARDQPKCCAECWPNYLDGASARTDNGERRDQTQSPAWLAGWDDADTDEHSQFNREVEAEPWI